MFLQNGCWFIKFPVFFIPNIVGAVFTLSDALNVIVNRNEDEIDKIYDELWR